MQMQDAASIPDRFLSSADVSARTRLSPSTIRRLERAGKFPQRYRLSANRVGWRDSDVSAWVAARSQAGSGRA